MRIERNIDGQVRQRERILVFLPTASDFESLARCGALAMLGRSFDVTCVLPPEQGCVPALRPIETVELRLEQGRSEAWLAAFPAGSAASRFSWSRLSRPKSRVRQAIRAAASTAVGRAVARRLLWLTQLTALPVRARRLLLAVAGIDPSEDVGALPGNEGDMHSAPAPAAAIVDLLERTRPLFALLPAAPRGPWVADVLWACESREMPCVVLEDGWEADGAVNGTPPVLRCGKRGIVSSRCAAMLAEVFFGREAGREATALPASYRTRLVRLCTEVLAPYARRVRRLRTARQRGHITRAYGADHVARTYAQTPHADAAVPGYWMHGWLPAHHNVDPALIAQHKHAGHGASHDYDARIRREKRDVPQWVARADQAAYLARHGYRKVRAIGLPIVYTPPVRVTRLAGSLLVMPPHGHNAHGPGDPLAERYADAIADVSGWFSRVAVCLSQEDLERGQWADAFRRRGFEVFAAVDPYEPDALFRLKRMLSSFEFVTTNGFGSHIAYAAYCGARVSVFGPFAGLPIERVARTHAVRMSPELLHTSWRLCSEAPLRQNYPFLFVDPYKAQVWREWGAHEVGDDCKLPPDALARLFGWSAERHAVPDAVRAMPLAMVQG